MSRHLGMHVLDAYDDIEGAEVALLALLPRPEGMGHAPAVLVVVVLSVGCGQAEVVVPEPVVVISAQHQHDAAIGVALYVCIQAQKDPVLHESFAPVWHEITVGRDFAGVSAACVPSAALLACEAKEVWSGIDRYFEEHPRETCRTVAETVDRARQRAREER